MNTFTYFGLEVKQTPDSDPFYLLVSSAHEILKWADVPRKQENFLAGYQRQLDDRYSKITEYFNQPDSGGRNIIPSSIIVAIEKGKIKVTPEGGNGLVRIDIAVEDLTLEELLTKTVASLKSRLGSDELASIGLEGDDFQESSSESDEEEIPPESYLSIVVKKLEDAGQNMQTLDENFRQAVEEYLKGVSKPGLILDGQHRVFGAKNVSSFPVFLPVVMLPGLSFSEQVFHFYVLNNKAKPLNKTELRSIIATSLGKEEIKNLYDRFKQVGVTAEETAWTYKMNTDPESPFGGLVNFGIGGVSSSPIPENVAYQVVSKFIKINKKYRMLFADVENWGSDLQTGADYRLRLFYSIWRGVRSKYPSAWNSAVESGGGQILQKVNLIVLQEFLLDKLVAEMPKRKAKGEKSPFTDPTLLEEEIGFQLAFLSEEFYTTEWRMKGLDTATGHKAFRDAIDDAVNNQSQNLGNRKLFRATPK
jgi:hypothetical protein